MKKRVLNIGSCPADNFRLQTVLEREFDVDVTHVDTDAEARAQVADQAWDLILINRILDGDGACGLDLIEAIVVDALADGTPVLLVSNFPESQREALRRGARGGFGKAALDSPETLRLLRDSLRVSDADARPYSP